MGADSDEVGTLSGGLIRRLSTEGPPDCRRAVLHISWVASLLLVTRRGKIALRRKRAVSGLQDEGA